MWTWFKLENWTWKTWIELIQERTPHVSRFFHCLTPFFVNKSAVNHRLNYFLNNIWRSPHTYTYLTPVLMFVCLRISNDSYRHCWRPSKLMLFCLGTRGRVHNIHVWNQSMPLQSYPQPGIRVSVRNSPCINLSHIKALLKVVFRSIQANIPHGWWSIRDRWLLKWVWSTCQQGTARIWVSYGILYQPFTNLVYGTGLCAFKEGMGTPKRSTKNEQQG